MPPEILIIRLSALGDVIHTLPVAAAIKRYLPESRITWLVEKMSAPLLFNNPAVDRVIVFPGKTLLPSLMATPPSVTPLNSLRQFWQELKSENYDIAIDAQGLFKSAFLGWLSGAKIRIGFANTREWADKFLTHPVDVGDFFAHDRHITDSYKQVALRSLALIDQNFTRQTTINPFPEFPLPVVPDNVRQKVQTWLNTLTGENEKAPVAVLIPGTTWATKIWPINKWQELSHLLIEHNGYKVILCGGISEILINKQLEEPGVLNLTGQTNLLELIALFKQVQLVIGGDTGPLHLADAVGKAKIIGIFGSTPWKRNGPIGATAHSIALNLDCQPCFAKTCRLKTIACLNDLSAEHVYQEISEFLLKDPAVNSFGPT